jgi:hypothetical protein
MMIGNLLRKIGKGSKDEAILLATFVAVPAIYFVPTLGLFALSFSIQSTEFGVLWLAVTLSFCVWLIHRTLDAIPSIRPRDFGSAIYKKRRKYATISAFVVPIALSWLQNETFYSAINPASYWKAESQETTVDICAITLNVLLKKAEELEVLQNKHHSGLATSTDVMDAANQLSLIGSTHKSCKANQDARKEKVRRELGRVSKLSSSLTWRSTGPQRAAHVGAG